MSSIPHSEQQPTAGPPAPFGRRRLPLINPLLVAMVAVVVVLLVLLVLVLLDGDAPTAPAQTLDAAARLPITGPG